MQMYASNQNNSKLIIQLVVIVVPPCKLFWFALNFVQCLTNATIFDVSNHKHAGKFRFIGYRIIYSHSLLQTIIN